MRKVALTTLTLLAFAAPALLGQRTPPSPATIVAREVQHLTALLDLNTTEIGVATKAFTDALTANSPLETELRADRKQLQADIQSNSPNTGMLAATIGMLEGEILANNAGAEQIFYASLEPAQQTKYNQLGHGGRGFGPGGPGAFGHP